MHLYYCAICGYTSGDEVVVEVVEEEHDLVYNYVEDKYECRHCDYWE